MHEVSDIVLNTRLHSFRRMLTPQELAVASTNMELSVVEQRVEGMVVELTKKVLGQEFPPVLVARGSERIRIRFPANRWQMRRWRKGKPVKKWQAAWVTIPMRMSAIPRIEFPELPYEAPPEWGEGVPVYIQPMVHLGTPLSDGPFERKGVDW